MCSSDLVTYRGQTRTIKVWDVCPECCKQGHNLKHIDISHTCRGANMDVTIDWDPGCKGINQKGRHGSVRTRN